MNPSPDDAQPDFQIEQVSAVTLATSQMARSVRFYRSLGFDLRFGGENAEFSTLRAGATCLNLIAHPEDRGAGWWGRVIFYVSDVDAVYAHALRMGMKPDTTPRDAEWGERYFHITDPDGHELSFAQPLTDGKQ